MKKWFTLVVAVGLLGFTACSGSSSSKKSVEVKEGNTSLKLIIPQSAEKLVALIDAGKGGTPISQPTPLFPRLELAEDEEAAA